MKKQIVVIMIVVVMLLAACGEGNKSVSEVITEAIQASVDLESYSTEMTIDTEVMGMQMTMDAKGDVTHNPDTLYMEMQMGMPGITMDVEMYAVEDEVYMGMFGEWIIMEAEELGIDSFDQLNEEELNKLNNFADQFEMTEEDGMYVLTLSGEGKDFEELIEPYLEATMGDFALDPGFDETVFDNINVTNIAMELKVNKKSMIFESQSVQTDIEVDGEAYQINVEAKILNINEVDSVEIPEEVKENAVTEGLFEEDYDFVEESLSIEELRERVDFAIPEVTVVPEGYELVDSTYFSDDYSEMAQLHYEGSETDYIVLTIYPSLEVIGEIYEDESTESMSINGNDAVYELFEELQFLSWEESSGEVVEIMTEGSLTKDQLIEFAEGLE